MSDLIGAWTAVCSYMLVILVFAARLAGFPRVEYGSGLCLIAMIIPLLYLLLTARSLNRPALYYIQLSLMIAYLIMELLLDYIFKIDFRSIRWMTIVYVTLFFAGTGGLIGVASHAGKR